MHSIRSKCRPNVHVRQQRIYAISASCQCVILHCVRLIAQWVFDCDSKPSVPVTVLVKALLGEYYFNLTLLSSVLLFQKNN